MKLLTALVALVALSLPGAAQAAPEIGKPAPDFSAPDIAGNVVKLSDLKGKPVVLEWTNHECPFVRKHYDSGNMQALQKTAAENGTVWISIVSSAEGKQGFTTPEQAGEILTKENAVPAHKILDPKGEIGRLYDAKTTPHMFVVDKDGLLVYAGAIDSDTSASPEAIKTAKNHVTAALDDLKAGRPVAMPQTEPYGCGVKY